MRYRLHVNEAEREVDVPAQTSLLEVLRDDLGLTSARFGCGKGQCGACFVLIDGRATASCTFDIADAVGRSIVTVEGLHSGEHMHPVQEAFVAEDAMQCGYCTSGMIISACALLSVNRAPTDEDIRDALGPNLCRCGVYLRAFRAVRRAAR